MLERLRQMPTPTAKTAQRLSPLEFTRQILGASPAPYQQEILEALTVHRRVAVRGPHGLGKTTIAAWCVLWGVGTFGSDFKVVTTASAWRQLVHFTWPEIHKWFRRAKWDVGGRPLPLTLSIKTAGGEAFAAASDRPDAIEGAHAAKLLYVFDEAKAIPDPIWDAAEGAFANGDCVLGSATVSAVGPEFVSRRWYKGEVIQVETVGGHKLTVTPKHPVLTMRGWVRAKGLQPSDQIVCCRDANAMMLGIEPETVQVPSRVEDVFELYSVLNQSLPSINDVLDSEDFNGGITNRKINVEAPNSLLNNGLVSRFNQDAVSPRFVGAANQALGLTGLSALDKFKFGFDFSEIAVSAFSGSGEGLFGVFSDIDALPLSNVAAICPILSETLDDYAVADTETSRQFSGRDASSVVGQERFSIRRNPLGVSAPHAARFDVAASKIVQDGTGCDAELFSKLDGVAAGNVFADQIVNLNSRHFEGHVYDLQTSNHWFVASDYSTDSDSVTSRGGIVIHNCYALAISTPGARAGRFYDIHRRAAGYEDWWVRHVTLAEAIAAGRISQAWADQRLAQWGEESPVYQARVLGNFPEQSEDALISLSWIEAARERELVPEGDEIAGVDVARYGEDDSAQLTRQGSCVMRGETWHGHDTMATVGRVKANGAHANVDVIGVGSGVYDRLNEQDFDCSPVNVGAGAMDHEHFMNLRSELAWNLRIRFQEGEIDLTRLGRELYERLSGELTALKYKYNSKGQIQLEPKDDMKKRLGRSPDAADALVLAFAPPPLLVESHWGDSLTEDYRGG